MTNYQRLESRWQRRYDDRGRIVERLLAENTHFRELLGAVLFNDQHNTIMPGSLIVRIREALALRNTYISDEDTETD